MLKLVDTNQPEPVGDAFKTRERIAQWSEGQLLCRRRKRHHWARFTSTIYGRRAFDCDVNDLPTGTRISVVERCPSCLNRRRADHLVIELGRYKGKNGAGDVVSKGLRMAEPWTMIYIEVKDVPYLLDPGSQSITDDLREEIYAAEFFAHPGRISYAPEGDEDFND